MDVIVIQKRNHYASTLGVDDRARPVTREDGSQKTLVFDSPSDAEDWIAQQEDEPYYLSNGESSRPEYWVVPEDYDEWVESVISDESQIDWDGCSCADGEDGSPCGLCDTCTDWLEGQIEAQLRGAALPNDAENA